MSELDRVADRWDESEWLNGIPPDYWSHHPIINSYINAAIVPHAENMLDWLAQNFLHDGPCARALSICCGVGVGDRQALRANVCRTLEGMDVSLGSVRVAQREAEREGLGDRVHYWVADANTTMLPENRYDVAIAFGAFHHIQSLEHLCGQVRRALKPDGLLLINEFVGPARFQWTEEQLTIINRVMDILPPTWRRMPRVINAPISAVMAVDPSEAVRSHEVVSVLTDYFEVVDYRDYGGGLLMPLWANGLIPDVFMHDRHVDKQVIIKLLILIDELLAEHDIAPSNYAQLVLRNRPPAPGRSLHKRLPVESSDRSRWVDQWLPDTIFGDTARWPTPWWQLPGKAWRMYRERGPAALQREIRNYVRWFLAK